ncbi:MAG TPA: HAD-IB family phosphatase [Candidatus Dojkabacteria bacterium]|nr:HAD-IB family phosphatase [Candidatus Dojkabacteria bacterium]HRO64600.1 HAD-IB family phosphatase [Candidatus Dojkabacteria bacterium]HRP36800.1 HAD-IB family phosphatase [Candidatus Dojkabacteria bacterium]HRP50867.1 HAD-IB family phosphatase [Candidatus Dojkabacteria bacterium]
MNLSDLNTNIIIDFDSTFVKLEGLEELAKITLNGNTRKQEIINKIEEITNQGMTGKISFQDSLDSRLKMFKSSRSDIANLVDLLKENISESIIRNKNFFQDNSSNIYIISGGFEEWIVPIVKEFGIDEMNVLSNKFIYDLEDNISGIDRDIALCKTGGKIECVKNLKLSGNKVMIGDGYTDYEVKKSGEVDKFVLFTENVHRTELDDYADYTSKSWEDVLAFLESLHS